MDILPKAMQPANLGALLFSLACLSLSAFSARFASFASSGWPVHSSFRATAPTPNHRRTKGRREMVAQ